ncbi:hypothetical protein ARMSODRAFT_685067 [Armillaria solidipes]|uniref:Uncharacterized protein n=1 Tax=Armillaria solidipes TaxID=1076256 RepID=A0A2H3APU5_9AGAR|nr:hypothetical protein ARMSODRAFT_685067 [Armillaria solidipes]
MRHQRGNTIPIARQRSTLGCKPDAQFCHFRAFRGRFFSGQRREAAAELTIPVDVVAIDRSRKRSAAYLFYSEKCREIPRVFYVSRDVRSSITRLY